MDKINQNKYEEGEGRGVKSYLLVFLTSVFLFVYLFYLFF